MNDEHMINEAIKEDIHMKVLDLNIHSFVKKLRGIDRGRTNLMVVMSLNSLDLYGFTVKGFIDYLKDVQPIVIQNMFDEILGRELDRRFEEKADSWVT